jgi:hypothetical protein
MVKQEHEKIMFAAVALIMVVTAFFGGIAYGKTQVVCPDDQVDIVITQFKRNRRPDPYGDQAAEPPYYDRVPGG